MSCCRPLGGPANPNKSGTTRDYRQVRRVYGDFRTSRTLSPLCYGKRNDWHHEAANLTSQKKPKEANAALEKSADAASVLRGKAKDVLDSKPAGKNEAGTAPTRGS